jgi:hypothetical protein
VPLTYRRQDTGGGRQDTARNCAWPYQAAPPRVHNSSMAFVGGVCTVSRLLATVEEALDGRARLMLVSGERA